MMWRTTQKSAFWQKKIKILIEHLKLQCESNHSLQTFKCFFKTSAFTVAKEKPTVLLWPSSCLCCNKTRASLCPTGSEFSIELAGLAGTVAHVLLLSSDMEQCVETDGCCTDTDWLGGKLLPLLLPAHFSSAVEVMPAGVPNEARAEWDRALMFSLMGCVWSGS